MTLVSRPLAATAILLLGFGACADTTESAQETAGAPDTVGADTSSASDATPPEDAPGAGDALTGDGATTAPEVPAAPTAFEAYSACFPHIAEGLDISLDFDIEVSETCAGTANQSIGDIDKLVILGDSISAGAGAGSNANAYFSLLHANLEAFLGHSVELVNCAAGGAVNSDLVNQINGCFGSAETSKTLVVFTSGGNDVADMAFGKLSLDAGKAAVDTMIGHLEAALALFDDPNRFPDGVSVVFANVYEYTDATADMSACPLAFLAGLSGTWDAGLSVFTYMIEEYARVAAEFGRDVIFMEETFCGHGYASDSPDSPCSGVAGDLWFAGDCIHPNAKGHKAIADLFYAVITGQNAP